MMAAYDIVIRNGQVADGTGRKLFAADVALKGDRIAAVEAPGSLKGDNEIDAEGKVVAPGFIDVHTHDDTALIDNPTMAMKASQGVTTVVCGNCGVSAAPYIRSDVGHFLSLIVKKQGEHLQDLRRVRGQGRCRQARHQRRLPDRPLDAAHEHHGRRSRRAPRPRARSPACATCSTRAWNRAPSACRAACSTPWPTPPRPTRSPRWPSRSASGAASTPPTCATRASTSCKAMDETFEIGRRAGASIVVSHHKCSGRTNFGRMKETLPKFTEAMKQQEIAFDVYPYIAGSTILRSDMLERADKVLITWSDKVPG